MLREGRPGGLKVPRKYVEDIRKVADGFRWFLCLVAGIDKLSELNLAMFIEKDVPEILGLEVQIEDDADFLRLQEGAPAGVDGNILYIRDSVYLGMIRSFPRDVFTLFHELGHVLLGHRQVLGRDRLGEHSWTEDSEWQANWFAGEILMPLEEIRSKRLLTSRAVADYFRVSEQAASLRLHKLRNRGDR